MGQLSGIKISTPTFNEVVPSTKQKVKLTPFRVGDEKVLLMASQSKDNKQMLSALKTVIANCVSGIEVEKLAHFDLEYLFLKLRAVSVGETSEVGIKCESCEHINKITVDLTTVNVHEDKSHTKIIKITNDLIFEMKYPDVDVLVNMNNDIERFLKIVCNSVDKVYHGEDIYEITESDHDDVKNILNNLSSKQFNIIQNFFTTLPKMKHDVDFKCKKCSHDNKKTIEGLASFF
jgi:hypothetical protein